MASAISLISPSLGQWVLAGDKKGNWSTAFYDRLAELLETRGLKRKPAQTHREFAKDVALNFADYPQGLMIGSTVWEITDIYHDIRFGKKDIPADLREQIELCLGELEEVLNT